MDVTQDHHNYRTYSFIKKIEQKKIAINLNRYLQSTGLFLLFLLSIKLIITFATVFIYAKVTPFNDATYYLSNHLISWDSSLIFHRTLFTEYLFFALKSLLHYDLLVHCFVSVILGLVLWYVIKPEYHYVNKILLFSCLCLPHFLVWTGIVGKEAIAISGFLLIIRASIDLIVSNKFRYAMLSIGLFLALIERPHYAIAYIYLFVASFIIVKCNIEFTQRSAKKSFALLGVSCIFGLMLAFFLEPYYSNQLLHFMGKVQNYFANFPDAHTTRTDFFWSQSTDFFANMPWGIPISIIGPTLFESLKRIILFPVFIEGCIAFTLVIINSYLLLRCCKKNPNYTSIIIWGFLPALIMGLIINYPFGLFNVGSAIRYKQSLAPLFYFWPILFIATMGKKKATNNIT